MAALKLTGWKVWPFRVVFLAVFVLCTVPAWILTAITDLPFLAPKTTEGKRQRGQFLAKFTSAWWRLAMRICWWLRFDTKGLEELTHKAGTGKRGAFVIVNHVSYLDTPLVCVLTPWRTVGDMKTLMGSRFLKLPILGRLANAIGHLPIPYTTRTNGDFHMDREWLARTMQRVDEHVNAGGHLVVFPEAELNADWQKLKQFRAGGFEISIRHDMEIWGLVVAGTADTWPESVPLGGGPALLRAKAVLIQESARDAACRLAGPDAGLQQQGRALAADAQVAMQRVLDELVALRSEDAVAPAVPASAGRQAAAGLEKPFISGSSACAPS